MIRYTICSGSSGTVVMLELVGVRCVLCRRSKQLGDLAAGLVYCMWEHAW